MPTILIDGKPVIFPGECLGRSPRTRHRERLILKEALEFPPSGERGYNRYDEIAGSLNKRFGTKESGSAIKSVLIRIRRRVRKWRTEQDLARLRVGESKLETSADAFFRDWIGLSERPAPEEPELLLPDRRQVFVLADLHGFPHSFLLPTILQTADYDHRQHFVYAGDLYDIFCSSGVGLKDGVPLGAAEFGQERYRNESAAIAGFMQALHTKLPGSQHHILRGNHDEIRKLFDRTPYWAIKEFVRDPLQELADLFPNTRVTGWNVAYYGADGTVIPDYKHVPYAVIFGHDLFISHLNKTGGKPFKSVNQTWGWIQSKRMVHGLDRIRCVLQAHSHKLSMQDIQGGHVRLGEIGFGGDPGVLRYQVGYNVWNSETAVGCVVLEQELDEHGRWITDLNSVRHLRP
jgi:hypothetical protein